MGAKYESANVYLTDNVFVHKFSMANKIFVSKVFTRGLLLDKSVFEKKLIDITKLYPSELVVKKDTVDDFIRHYRVLPEVVGHNGILIIYDGHHRIVRKILDGLTEIVVNYIEIKEV